MDFQLNYEIDHPKLREKISHMVSLFSSPKHQRYTSKICFRCNILCYFLQAKGDRIPTAPPSAKKAAEKKDAKSGKLTDRTRPYSDRTRP